MTFTGWVALRRGLLEHTMLGKLTNTEALVLLTLILLADRKTGSGTINAPTLRTYLPELSYDAAKRALQSLEEKRYIFRAIVPFSKRVYPYWVNRYVPSDGPHGALQMDLEHVFESRDIKDIRYQSAALQGAREGALQGARKGAPQGALNNNNDTNNDNVNETTPSLIPVSGSVRVPDDYREYSAAQSMSQSQTQSERFHECVHECVTPAPSPPRGAGMRWSGDWKVGYIDIATGNAVDDKEAYRRIEETVALFWVDGEFVDRHGHRVTLKAANALISGGAS